MKVTIGAICEPGTAMENKTGGWRTFMPVFNYDKCIRCANRETFGYPTDITIELDEGRAHCIRLSYPVDRDYKIYYDLKAAFVSKYGKPDNERFDAEHTDNWTAKKFLVSLTVGPSERTSDNRNLSNKRKDGPENLKNGYNEPHGDPFFLRGRGFGRGG